MFPVRGTKVNQAVFDGVLVGVHVLIVLAIVVEVGGSYSLPAGNKKAAIGASSEMFPGRRHRAGELMMSLCSRVPPPSLWRAFRHRGSVSEGAGPRRIPGTAVVDTTAERP